MNQKKKENNIEVLAKETSGELEKEDFKNDSEYDYLND